MQLTLKNEVHNTSTTIKTSPLWKHRPGDHYAIVNKEDLAQAYDTLCYQRKTCDCGDTEYGTSPDGEIWTICVA